MALGVVSVKHDGTKGVVILQSNLEDGSLAIQELQSGLAKNKATEAAAKEGLPDPRTEMAVAPYAVDEKGEAVPLGPNAPKIAAYRVDIPVTRRLV